MVSRQGTLRVSTGKRSDPMSLYRVSQLWGGQSGSPCSGKNSVNTFPRPLMLSTVRDPPRRLTSCWVIDRPSVAPWKGRATVRSWPVSAGGQSKATCSSEMSVPVMTMPGGSSCGSTVVRIVPRSVYFPATPTILKRTCRTRDRSPRTNSGSRGLYSTSKTHMPLRPDWLLILTSCIMRAWRSNRSLCNRMASGLEKSRMELRRSVRATELCRESASNSCWSGVMTSESSQSRDREPMMPFKGLRISWHMLARKPLFAAEAFSALSLARMRIVWSLSCRAESSAFLRRVISWTVTHRPWIFL
mmetsp:Transcript_14124/g.32963  ORF Transcript_14124/g.32963 Transcript_14124/m.32963 type:complete len:302 (-) Transcript_14124:279-1184(-)